jgi:hypothetical protein
MKSIANCPNHNYPLLVAVRADPGHIRIKKTDMAKVEGDLIICIACEWPVKEIKASILDGVHFEFPDL